MTTFAIYLLTAELFYCTLLTTELLFITLVHLCEKCFKFAVKKLQQILLKTIQFLVCVITVTLGIMDLLLQLALWIYLMTFQAGLFSVYIVMMTFCKMTNSRLEKLEKLPSQVIISNRKQKETTQACVDLKTEANQKDLQTDANQEDLETDSNHGDLQTEVNQGDLQIEVSQDKSDVKQWGDCGDSDSDDSGCIMDDSGCIMIRED